MSAKPTTYAEVDRRISQLRRTGASDEQARLARNVMWQQVAAYRQRQNDLKRCAIVPHAPRLDAIRADIAAHYKVPAKALFKRLTGATARNNRSHVSARRAFVVAARKIGYSTIELAMYLKKPGAHSSIVYMYQHADDEAVAVADIALQRDRQRRATMGAA